MMRSRRSSVGVRKPHPIAGSCWTRVRTAYATSVPGLHLYEVPVWRLPVDIRRGDRRYPLTLDWLIPLTRFSDISCPHCGADERLVATKTGLGCAGCVPQPAVRLAPEPTKPSAKPAMEAKHVVAQPSIPKKRALPACTDLTPAPAKIPKIGDKLTGKVWMRWSATTDG